MRDGHIHRGQLIGDGTGPGTNVHWVGVSWVKGVEQEGLQFERLVRDQDLATWTLLNYHRNWEDANIAAHRTYDYKQFYSMRICNSSRAAIICGNTRMTRTICLCGWG